MNHLGKINLEQLIVSLRKSLGIIHKQDVQVINHALELSDSAIAVEDDCIAIPDGESYLLLASEGIWDALDELPPIVSLKGTVPVA